MDREVPIFNNPVMQKIIKKNQQTHRQRLKNIMNGKNKNTIHKKFTLSQEKALLLQKTRQFEIQRNNTVLFNKMANIVNRQNSYRSSHNNRSNKFAINPRTTSALSGINERSIFKQSISKSPHKMEVPMPSSSNNKFTQQHHKNLTFLKFFRKSLSKDAKNRESIKRHSQPRQLQRISQSSYYDQQVDFLSTQKNPNTYIHKKNHSLGKAFKLEDIRKIRSQNSQQPIPQAFQIDETSKNHQILLNQVYCKISGRLTLLRFIRQHDSYEIEAIYKPKTKQSISYKIEFPQQVGNEFFMNLEYDYRKIAQLLYIEDETLKIYSQSEKQEIKRMGRLPKISNKSASKSIFAETLQKIVEEIF